MPGRCARLLLFSAAIALLSATTARAGHVRADAALDLRLSTSAAVSAERLASLFSDHAAAERSLASHTATAATPALLATPLGGLGELETELSGTHRIEQLLDAEPRRGPPPCIAETRIGGLELLGEARIGEDAGLTDSTQRGCGSSWLECASGFAFEVEGDHTYFVTGEDGGPAVWVHNSALGQAVNAARKRTRAIARGLQYEVKIAGLYGGRSSFSQRLYGIRLNGRRVTGVADNVTRLAGLDVAIEAKYVKKWATSIRNPNSRMARGLFRGSEAIAARARQEVLDQAIKYSNAFKKGGVIYHSNSLEFIDHYSKVFREHGLTNITFVHTPF